MSLTPQRMETGGSKSSTSSSSVGSITTSISVSVCVPLPRPRASELEPTPRENQAPDRGAVDVTSCCVYFRMRRGRSSSHGSNSLRTHSLPPAHECAFGELRVRRSVPCPCVLTYCGHQHVRPAECGCTAWERKEQRRFPRF